MELTLQPFLLLLRKLVSFLRRRWDHSTHRLWYAFAFLRSRFSPPHPKKRGEIRRNVESYPENPPTIVICASRLPPPLTPVAGGDTPIITSPTPISIRVRKPVLNHEDPLYETQENYSNEDLGVDGHHLEESGTISRSHNSADHHDENEYTNIIVPQSQEYFASNSPVTPSPSRPASRQPSVYSRRSSTAHSIRSPSIAGSVTSQVYRASRPTTRVRVPPLAVSRRRGGSSTPTSARQNVHGAPQSGSQDPVSTHSDPHSTTVSFGPIPNTQGRLRPMIGIDRYEKHKLVVVEDEVNTHIFSPVTTEFVP